MPGKIIYEKNNFKRKRKESFDFKILKVVLKKKKNTLESKISLKVQKCILMNKRVSFYPHQQPARF